jgi:TusA-related sulfurtransferase
MKRLVILASILALLVSAPVLACGAGKAAAAGSHCPLAMKGVERTAENVDNGVKVTIASKDPAQVKSLQAAIAEEAKGEGGCTCAMHAKGVSRSVQNTENGVVLLLTSDDKEQVKTIQAFAADSGKEGCCSHDKGAKAADEKGGCQHMKEGKAAEEKGDCPHMKAMKGDRT